MTVNSIGPTPDTGELRFLLDEFNTLLDADYTNINQVPWCPAVLNLIRSHKGPVGGHTDAPYWFSNFDNKIEYWLGEVLVLTWERTDT